MTEMEKVEILLADSRSRKTRKEAEKALKNGTIIFEDFEENLERYLDDWGVEEDDREEYREMVRTGKPMEGWGVAENRSETYYIMYVC